VLLEDTRLPPFLSVRAALVAVCRLRGFAGRHLRAELDRIVAQARVRLGVRHGPSRYTGPVRLVVEEPEHALLGRLAAERIVPARIEPRVNLVTVYLELTGGATE
jgi:hypothetical protein